MKERKQPGPPAAGKLTVPRRTTVLIAAVGLLTGSGLFYLLGGGGSGAFAAAAMTRIGLVLLALWLAWPSLRRPAKWLPPGMAVFGIVALVLVAAHPALRLPAISGFMVLLSIASAVRFMRKLKE